jgi:putative transposase
MSEKLNFIERATTPGANVAALCREYGVSRQTGHKWIRRYRKDGYAGLVEQSRRPVSSPLATGEEIVVSILELKQRHPSYGPQKISLILARKLGASAPARSTVARVLLRLGKVKRRRSSMCIWPVEGRPRVEVNGPNDLWTIDFKGWWRARNGDKCEPLTVRDAFSRKVLAVVLVASVQAAQVRRVLEQLFRNN